MARISRKDSGVESNCSKGIDESKVLSPRSVMQLRDALVCDSLPTKKGLTLPGLGGSLFPPSSCQTPPNEEDSDLSTFLDSQGSVGSCLEDLHTSLHSDGGDPALNVENPTCSSPECSERSFVVLRITYLLVTLVIMLADGLQGTHLYVLYESYGFSVASLYCLGFATGGLMSPITGPLVDKLGRKKSAILYCLLEIFINMLEQYPVLAGLIASRMIGGFTTNLLSSVFETWLDTEYRRRGLEKEKYELIMRDSVIVSNMSAIFSGYLAHTLAQRYGAVGPFEGAVTCTAVALVVVCFVWTENYGSTQDASDGEKKDMLGYFKEAVSAYKEDNKMRCVGLLQGLTAGSIQIFVFLWAPTLRHFAQSAPQGVLGLDEDGEPAYGLIFGAFMGAGVLGGFAAPRLRQVLTSILSPIENDDEPVATIDVDGEGIVPIRPMAVEVLCSACYLLSAFMLFIPYFCSGDSALSFSSTLAALLVYEFLIGVFLPCEGVIRSLYFPANARASVMTFPRLIVNVAVAIGVVSTNYVSLKTAFFAVGCLMIISSALQLSLVSEREWSNLYSRMDKVHGNVARQARSLSFTVKDFLQHCPPPPEGLGRRVSVGSATSSEDSSDDSILFDDSSSFCTMTDVVAKVKAD